MAGNSAALAAAAPIARADAMVAMNPVIMDIRITHETYPVKEFVAYLLIFQL